jgi:hypothetical protein
MKRSAHPLHSGSPTNAGVSVKPQIDLVHERVRRVLWTPVVAQGHAERALRRDRAESRHHALPNRLQGRPAIAELRDVPAHDLGRVVIDRAEEPAPSLALGVEARRVRAPHLVRARREDRARVGRVAVRVARAARDQQLVRAHQAEHPLAPDADALGAQPEVHLAMPLAVERAGREDGANLDEQLLVREPRLRATFPAGRGDRRDGSSVDARAGRVQRRADERHRVAALRAGAYSSPERFNFFNSSP